MGRRRLLPVLVVLTLLLGSSLPANVAIGSTTDPGWLPELRDSADLGGPVVIGGRAQTRTGLSAAGARLTLVAWPLDDVLARTEVGDSIKLSPVGKAVAGTDGRFVMRIDPAAPIGEFMRPDGIVNFDLQAEGVQGRKLFSFSGRLAGSSGWLAANTAGNKPIPDVAMTLDWPARVSSSSLPPATDKFCVTTLVSTHNNRQHIVSEVYTGPDAEATVTYTYGADSTVGVGFSLTGEYGSYEQSGTTTTSSTATVGFPVQGPYTVETMRTNFGWKNWKTECWERGAYWKAYYLRPYEFQGGVIQAQSATPVANYCHSYPAGSYLIRTSGTAYTFSQGVKVGSVIGIDLTSRTGFASNASLRYDMLRSGRICGTDTYEGSAKRIVAKG
jgi:hypothetical protein